MDLTRVPGSLKRFGTAAFRMTGIAAGQIPLLDASARLPAVDGSQLTNLPASAFPNGLLYGMTLANNGGTPLTDIDVAVGNAADSTNAVVMNLLALTTKRLSTSWAVGTNQGGLDQGTIANATYHVHAIRRPDTGVVDAIFSLSHDLRSTVTMTIASPAVVTWGVAGAGHGLVAGSTFKFSTTGALPTGVTAGTQYYVIATGLTETTFQFAVSNGGAAVNSSGSQSGVHTGIPGPQMPTSYTQFRRIGSIIRSAGSIVAFTQRGDEFMRSVPASDVTGAATNTSGVLVTLSVPVGIQVGTIFTGHLNWSSAGNYVLFTSPEQANTAPTVNAFNFIASGSVIAPDSTFWGMRTNTSAQIRQRSDSSTILFYIITHGWIDTRGRNG